MRLYRKYILVSRDKNKFKAKNCKEKETTAYAFLQIWSSIYFVYLYDNSYLQSVMEKRTIGLDN